MSQHDYVIANDSGASVRADLNSALQAILSQNSGTSAPSSTSAGTMWLDTTGGAPYTLKIRDAGNNHWLTIASVTDPGSDGNLAVSAIEGTNVLSTGESGGSKFLREDGDGTCSWQAAGKIVQVAYTSTDTTAYHSISSNSQAELMSASAFTTTGSNKVLIMASMVYGTFNNINIVLKRDTTVIGAQTHGAGTYFSVNAFYGADNYLSGTFDQYSVLEQSLMFLDTPSAGTHTYKIFAETPTSYSGSAYINRTQYGTGANNSGYGGGRSGITLMEISP